MVFREDSSAIANLKSPKELLQSLADRARELRLSQNMRQADLARMSGVSLASLRRFETSGEISGRGLVQIALALNRAQDIDKVFFQEREISLFQKEPKQRQRARRVNIM